MNKNFATKLTFAMAILFYTLPSFSQKNNLPHVNWIKQGNIYEVNVRQYTKEGTFKAFQKHLPRLKAMGVQTLWFMPITPIGLKDRKGHLGSYYAVANYTEINPEFGNLNDWKNLVKASHQLGFKVIIDWVANHTGADNPWLEKHPNFFKRDKEGNAMVAYDWTDTRKLDFSNKVLHDSMINAMKYWLTETNIDGFRCDVAGEVPHEFWSYCINELNKVRKVFMLAEGDEAWLHHAGFDATYCWEYFSMSKKVANGERPAFALDSVINKYNSTYPTNYTKLYFTSNHDENSWNKADYATMPGEIHTPFAVLTHTLGNSIPLIYGGQEEPFLDSISFFYKDEITFKRYARASLYQKLLNARNNNPALAIDASCTKVNVGNAKNTLYAFIRQSGKNKILVVVNLSRRAQQFQPNEKSIYGKVVDLLTDKAITLSASAQTIEAWGARVWKFE